MQISGNLKWRNLKIKVKETNQEPLTKKLKK